MALPLAKDGAREMILGTVVLLGLAGVSIWWLWPWIGLALAAPPLVVWVWVIAFFRDPDRPVPQEPGLFVSPADGTVTDITPLGPDSELGREGVSVGIFLSVFSVHINRAPCQGEVVETKYRKGEFLDARDREAGRRNESMALRLNYRHAGQTYPIIAKQIAGKIARRIICHAQPGQTLARGERFGLIKFGSRTELLLPKELAGDIRVHVGQKVQGAKTILAAHSLAEAKP